MAWAGLDLKKACTLLPSRCPGRSINAQVREAKLMMKTQYPISSATWANSMPWDSPGPKSARERSRR